MQVVVVALVPGARVVRQDGLGAAQDDVVVWGGQLQVVVPNVAAPVLGAGGAEEAGGAAGLEGADGADGLEDEVGVLWEDVRGPGVLGKGRKKKKGIMFSVCFVFPCPFYMYI